MGEYSITSGEENIKPNSSPSGNSFCKFESLPFM